MLFNDRIDRDDINSKATVLYFCKVEAGRSINQNIYHLMNEESQNVYLI